MDESYLQRARRFRRLYWDGVRGDSTPVQNGFDEYPSEVYDLFCDYVDGGRILDLGCGTGLLLRHLVERASRWAIPYGVDFLEEAVEAARRNFPRRYASNFVCCDIMSFLPKMSFQYVLLEPSLLFEKDRWLAVERMLSCLDEGGALVLYAYHDSMVAYSIRTIEDYFPEHAFCLSRYRSDRLAGIDIARVGIQRDLGTLQ